MRRRRDDGEDWPVEAGSFVGTGTPDTEQAVRFLGHLVQLLVSGLSPATVLTMERVRRLPVILKVLGLPSRSWVSSRLGRTSRFGIFDEA